MPSMFENKHFSEMSSFHHVEPSTLMPYQLENPDWMVKENMENNTTTWNNFEYQFHQELYPNEETYDYRSSVDSGEFSPSSVSRPSVLLFFFFLPAAQLTRLCRTVRVMQSGHHQPQNVAVFFLHPSRKK